MEEGKLDYKYSGTQVLLTSLLIRQPLNLFPTKFHDDHKADAIHCNTIAALSRSCVIQQNDRNLPELPSVPVRLRELTPLNDEDWLAELLLLRFQSEQFKLLQVKGRCATHFGDTLKVALHNNSDGYHDSLMNLTILAVTGQWLCNITIFRSILLVVIYFYILNFRFVYNRSVTNCITCNKLHYMM